MKIGFLSNQLDNRGTGNALFNYAHYNEEILGNRSSIYTFSNDRHDAEAFTAFEKRFGKVNFVSDGYLDIDALYHIKSGFIDGFNPSLFNSNLPYLVHAVFDNEPHGTVYATVSPWMGARYNLPFVPHMVDLFPTKYNLRDRLGIESGAVVFGRHGGIDTFDIPFVWDEINDLTSYRDDVYFLFMNTAIPETRFKNPTKIIFLPATVDPYQKRAFINTCDAMIHARQRGETFGLSVGEFAVAGKPVITYANSPEKAHLQELGHFAFLYDDRESLKRQFMSLISRPALTWGYGQYTPENVMNKFNEVFLSGLRNE